MRPRLEETNEELAIRAVKLAFELGIKPAARATGISKNTVRALLVRQNALGLFHNCATARRIWKQLKPDILWLDEMWKVLGVGENSRAETANDTGAADGCQGLD